MRIVWSNVSSIGPSSERNRTIHGGEFQDDGCRFTREVNDYERLYSLDVLGVEDWWQE